MFLIRPSNLSVLSRDGMRARVNALMNVLKGFPAIELLCLNSRESFETNKRYLLERIDEEEVVQIRELLSKDLDHLNQIQIQTASAREFLILIRLRNIKQKEIYPYLGRMERLIREQGFKVKRANMEDIKRILAVYFAQDVTSEHYDNFDGERFLFVGNQSDYKAPSKIEEAEVLKTFLDLIAPSVVKFETDHYICGNTWRCVWAVRNYAAATEDHALLQHLGEQAGVTLHIYTRRVPEGEVQRIFQDADKATRFTSASTDINAAVAAESDREDAVEILRSSHRNREPFYHTAVYIELLTDDEDKFLELRDSVKAELARSKINVDYLNLHQREGFLCVMPSGFNILGEQFERMLPASSVANLFPFSYSGKTDEHGFYVGYDKYGSSIIVDLEQRDEDKTNANTLILGNSGQGKSYFLKQLVCNILESGKNVICLDVEGEYRSLTEKLGGYYIDLSTGEYLINVLQPSIWNVNGQEDESNDYEPMAFRSKTQLSQHISFLRDFFCSYKKFEGEEIDTIELMLAKLYQRHNITDTSNFSALQPADC
ncbi:TraG/VirB4 family ATPase [Anaerotruncus rubiinfantis]|uniref:TraG/VirB4 family ATPase n=1 Tax=Anaerotruncus rubiinfantis TaxID=1720200 RepID=UPI00082EF97F|nr:DUF87 domain-containing protein [Anaerotruncus rubiinfantis]